MKTPEEIVKILHSIKDIRLNSDNKVEVMIKDDWIRNEGFTPDSFIEQLLLLIEEALQGKLARLNDQETDEMTPDNVLKHLHQITNVRLNKQNEIEAVFDRPTIFPDGWEPNCGFIYNCITQNLLALIENELCGNLAE